MFCDMLEKLLNYKPDKLFKMAFDVYNYNDDKHVCYLDLFSMMKLYEQEDEIFIKAFSFDYC
jgi:hypothetical protein